MVFRPSALVGLSILLSAAALELAAQATGPMPPDAPEPATGAPARESWAAEARPVPVDQTPGQVAIFDEEDILRSGACSWGGATGTAASRASSRPVGTSSDPMAAPM